MRPYVIETVFIFTAGLCVGAWLNERRHMEDAYPVTEEPEQPKTDEPKGVNVKLQYIYRQIACQTISAFP